MSRTCLSLLLATLLSCAACRDAAVSSGPSSAPAGSSGVQVSPPAAWFQDATAASGLPFTYRSGHRTEHWIGEMVGGGVALFDADGDGDLDAFLTPGGQVEAGPESQDGAGFFRNRGDGTFDDATAAAGLQGVRGYAMGVATGDADGDGDTDVFMTRYGRHALLANDGSGRFTDVTEASGLGVTSWGTSSAFFDADRDGDLDLYVANYIDWSPSRELVCYNEMGSKDYCGPRSYDAPTTDLFFRNEGGGRFTNATKAAGIEAAKGNGLGVVTADFDGDGWQDVFVANDGSPNFLWINQKDGTFLERGMVLGCAVDADGSAKAGMGISCEDVDGDDDLDLVIGNLFGESDSYFAWDGRFFKDRTRPAGLAQRPKMFTRFAMIFADFDQDGCFDLFEANGRVMRHAKDWSADPYAEPNLVFRGDCKGAFTELLPEGAMATPVIASSRGAAHGDLDGDGALDLVVVNRDAPVHVLRNVVPQRGGWCAIRVLERSGADALGATLRGSAASPAGTRHVRRDVRTSGSYVSAVSPIIHVGLGAAPSLTGLEVTWIDGTKEAFPDAAAGSVTTLRRGSGQSR